VDLVLRTDALQTTVDREFPNPIHREQSSRLQAEAVRGALRLEPRNGGLLWTVPVEFWARASIGPLRFSCGVGAPRPQVDVTLRTELRIDNAWNLSTTTTAGRRRWSRRCTVSFMNIDVTSMIDPHIAEAQARAAREIDSQAELFDLRPLLMQAWAMAAIALDLHTSGDALRFGMVPVGLRVGALSGDVTELRLRLAVVGRFWIAPRVRFALAGALPPPLESPAPAFVANLELPLELAGLQSELQAAVQGVNVGEDIRVTDVELRIVTEGIAVSVELTGASTPNVWALGTLVHDGGVLSIAALHWSDATAAAIHDEMLRAALSQPLFAALSRWQHPVEDALREIRDRALAGMQTLALGFDGVSLRAELEVPSSGGVVFGGAQELVLRVPMPGQLTVTVDASSVAGSL
jgi:hypothetical protein